MFSLTSLPRELKEKYFKEATKVRYVLLRLQEEKKEKEEIPYAIQSQEKKRKQRDVRMYDDTEKYEDDQRGKENSPPRKN